MPNEEAFARNYPGQQKQTQPCNGAINAEGNGIELNVLSLLTDTF